MTEQKTFSSMVLETHYLHDLPLLSKQVLRKKIATANKNIFEELSLERLQELWKISSVSRTKKSIACM